MGAPGERTSISGSGGGHDVGVMGQKIDSDVYVFYSVSTSGVVVVRTSLVDG